CARAAQGAPRRGDRRDARHGRLCPAPGRGYGTRSPVPQRGTGVWSVPVSRSSWSLALLRGGSPMRWTRWTALASMLALLAAVVAVLSCAAPAAKTAPPAALTQEQKVERGMYLTTIMGCNDCHTPGTFYGQPDFGR